MKYLVDTNVMFRRVHLGETLHEMIKTVTDELLSQGHELFITGQNLVEYWALATRPATANGLNKSPLDAKIDIEEIKSFFDFISETPSIYPLWEELAETYGVIGRQVYDTRLVAVMRTNEISHILTFNGQDFKRFAGITPVDPNDIYADLTEE